MNIEQEQVIKNYGRQVRAIKIILILSTITAVLFWTLVLLLCSLWKNFGESSHLQCLSFITAMVAFEACFLIATINESLLSIFVCIVLKIVFCFVIATKDLPIYTILSMFAILQALVAFLYALVIHKYHQVEREVNASEGASNVNV